MHVFGAIFNDVLGVETLKLMGWHVSLSLFIEGTKENLISPWDVELLFIRMSLGVFCSFKNWSLLRGIFA